MGETVIVVLGCPEGEPGPACKGKFLQLTWGGRDYLVFAAAEAHQYHTQILRAFAAASGIGHRWTSDDRLEIDDPGLSVRGGGRFQVDPAARVLEVWDNSQAYGPFDRTALPAQVAGAGHAWSGFVVRIG
jgi:hypothetical protein